MADQARKKTKPGNSWMNQYASRFFEHGMPHIPGLVAQIFFPTDVHTLDDDDKAVLDALIGVLRPRLLGDRITMRMIGHADPRGSSGYNMKLGYSRALAVKSYVDGSLSRFRLYASSAGTRGELDPSGDLAGDRKVDVFSSYIPKRPRIVLPEETITGDYDGPLSNKFKFRTFVGAGVSMGPVGAQAITIEIQNSRTGRRKMFTYSGAGAGIGVSYNRPSDWDEKEIPAWLDVGDFEGNGRVASGGVIAGGSIYIFDGPKERGKTAESLALTFDGWDLQVGFGADFTGYWHERD